jgi:hypothetical protein
VWRGVLVTAVLAISAWVGCGTVDDRSSSVDEAAEAEAQQAVTGCELDCPGGQVFTCSEPCSVGGGVLNCNGVETVCPPVCNTCASLGLECGQASDGCGNVLSCGGCAIGSQCVAGVCEFVGCPVGRVDCCGDGVCVSPTLCRKLGC